MGAATVTNQLSGEYVHIGGIEVVHLTVDDGDTYKSKKFSVILGAIATGNTDTDADLNVEFSGQTATINWNGVSADLITLMLFGRP